MVWKSGGATLRPVVADRRQLSPALAYCQRLQQHQRLLYSPQAPFASQHFHGLEERRCNAAAGCSRSETADPYSSLLPAAPTASTLTLLASSTFRVPALPWSGRAAVQRCGRL